MVSTEPVLLAFALACAPQIDLAEVPCPLATNLLVATEDGATIALHHHPGKGPAVLLVHGVSSNARFWDLDADHSLAVWLVQNGFDPWLLDLRGHGSARRDADGSPQISGWTVDDYGRYDVASAVDYVRVVTGVPQVAYIGHSMGGMVGAIYVANGGGPKLSSMVLVGSPARFDRKAPMMGLAQGAMAAGGASLFWVETGLAGQAAAALGPAAPRQLQSMLYNQAHLRPGTERSMLRHIASPLSREEMQQFGRMLKAERFESADASTDWTAAFHATGFPALAIAGGADQVGRPEFVRPWGTGAGSSYVEIPDYGHLDLGLGEDAEIDVFPTIGEWLRAHPPTRPTPGSG